MILAGDIGATNARLALYRPEGERFVEIAARVYPSRDYDGLEPIALDFAAGPGGPIRAACFGVPGPVRAGRSATTNLPWLVDAAALARVLGIDRAWLLNDLEASAWGLDALDPGDLVVLAAGGPTREPAAGGPAREPAAGGPAPAGNAALIAAGTGLGEAGLFWDGRRRFPFATEGGHAGFAPADARQQALLAWLLPRFGHVSWERVVSGPGLVNIYQFLRDTGEGSEPPWLREALREGDPPAVISRAALEGTSELCARALDLFVVLYGAEAGNLALKTMATGGVYVGGGIAPRILERLRDGRFLDAFRAKGRMRPLLESMPVRVVVNEKTALLGAARFAHMAEPP
jgi:glucokinase